MTTLVGTEDAATVRTPVWPAIEAAAALVVPRHEIAMIYGPHSTGKRTALHACLSTHTLPVIRVALSGAESGRRLARLLHDQVVMTEDLPERDLQDDLAEALSEQPRIIVIENAHRLTVEAANQVEWLHGRPGQQAAFFLVGGPGTPKTIGKDPLLWDATCATVEVRPLEGEALVRVLQSMHDLFLGAGADLLTEIDTRVCHGVIGYWRRFLQHALHLRAQLVEAGHNAPVLDRTFTRAVIASMPATAMRVRK
jgi:hypothetical protein